MIRTVDSSGSCAACRAERGNTAQKSWVKIGESVVIETTVGRAHDRTEFEFFQCPVCGSIWASYVESGTGGHGRFLKRLTDFFF
jgi:hypothetical protein